MSKGRTFYNGFREVACVRRMLILSIIGLIGYSIALIGREIGLQALEAPLLLLAVFMWGLILEPFVKGGLAVYRGDSA